MIFSICSETLAAVLQTSWSLSLSKVKSRVVCLYNIAGIRECSVEAIYQKTISKCSLTSQIARCCTLLPFFKEFLCLWRKRWGGGRELYRQWTVNIYKDKARGDKVCYSRRASLTPFEHPLRHLWAGSSLARSGPALNPLPAAWNGWQQLPALGLPLSERKRGRDRGINNRPART